MCFLRTPFRLCQVSAHKGQGRLILTDNHADDHDDFLSMSSSWKTIMMMIMMIFINVIIVVNNHDDDVMIFINVIIMVGTVIKLCINVLDSFAWISCQQWK